MEDKLLATLKKYWHHDSFRPMQREIIESVLAGRDTLALLPTGGGKSITYQLPTLLSEGLCIVVTPLIALMKDQVDALRRRGIAATAVYSGMTHRQIDIALDNCVYGDTKFLYIAPERMASDLFRLRVDRMKVALLAVDEAHCISQWGYDFRPSYLKIAELRELLPDTPVLALTASATPLVADDIMTQLHFAEPNTLQGSFARPNLSYCVRNADDKREQLLRVVRGVDGCGIVYVRRRKEAEELSAWLTEEGFSASFYHAGLPNEERAIRQDEWIANKVRIMVATNAFGMGIDKSDVRFVVHYAMPDSLESYYQEAGRAGRDGKRSYAVLLKGSDDETRIERYFKAQFPTKEVIRSVYHKMSSFLGVAIGDGLLGSYPFNIYELCRRFKLSEMEVRSSLKLLQMNGYITYIEESENPAMVLFTVERNQLYSLKNTDERAEKVMTAMMRLYPGIFTEFRAIDEMEIASMCRFSFDEVREVMKQLWRSHIIRYIPTNHTPLIFFDLERLPERDIYIAPETYSQRKALMEERFDHMLRYANSEDECRSRIIEEYFCKDSGERCGICDNCLARKRRTISNEEAERIDNEILSLVDGDNTTLHDLSLKVRGNQERILERITHLVEEGKIRIDSIGGTIERI